MSDNNTAQGAKLAQSARLAQGAGLEHEAARRRREHCAQLDRCNQRGGRMLSMLDLLDAGALDVDLAAWLMAGVSRGASFMVGARPGGAGKTTVMCALANLVPPDVELIAATDDAIALGLRETKSPRRCYVCHEIGAGPYYCYLWDDALRAYCSLSEKGHILATNLHADDLAEARRRVCDDNGVPERHFNAFHILVFLRVESGFMRARRRIEKVYLSDGASPHQLAYDSRKGLLLPPPAPEEWFARCRAFLEENLKTGARTIEEVRDLLLKLDGSKG